MKRNRRKLIVGILVATMALTGVLVGTVSADEEGSANHREALMARVAGILDIDQQDLDDAFGQALGEQREQRQEEMEATRDARIQELIDQGVLTQEQADDCTAWMESRPDNRDEMQEWFESRPDMGDEFCGLASQRMGMGGRMFGRGGPAGQMGGGGLGGSCDGTCDGCEQAS